MAPRSLPEDVRTEIGVAATILAGHAETARLAVALKGVAEGKCQSLDAALVGKRRRGGVPDWRQRDLDLRNANIRHAVAKHYPGLAPREAAVALANEIGRYETMSWPHDRARGSAPAGEMATLQHDLFRIFAVGAIVPRSVQQIQNVLEGLPKIHTVLNLTPAMAKIDSHIGDKFDG